MPKKSQINEYSDVCQTKCQGHILALLKKAILISLQGNSDGIDRNMSESKHPKLQKIDRLSSKMTES